jgi:hypothetical protein
MPSNVEDIEEAFLDAVEEEEITDVPDELFIDDNPLWEISSILDEKVGVDPLRPKSRLLRVLFLFSWVG